MTKARGLKEGYRSGLEEKIASQLEHLGIPIEYEKVKIKYRRNTNGSSPQD